ncbi:M14 family metallopeptidase [Robiginitalea sp.]|uniref:M14 family metallopeptidase n=1 Tax=Robiginitalea sp. TaxID=1902411 RepID=UPI003C70B453
MLSSSCVENTEKVSPDLQTPYERGNGNTTATYEELMEFYRGLAREYAEINLQTLGETDSGEPLHLITYSSEGGFDFQKLQKEKIILLILNGIHPGEPDGIDATSLLMRDLASGKVTVPGNIVISAIPVYNIGGALNRNSGSRANQNGPESYGFRGNSRNYDLNRDFLKMDTGNARTFASIFKMVRPHLFLDTHVSNGADYIYTLTHLFSQHNKLGGPAGVFLEKTLRPGLEKALMEKGWEITPYVNVFNRPPDGGFSQFMDYPRYSTGYAALWNTPGLMVETHMLKPYASRVEGTYELMQRLIGLAETHGDSLKILKEVSQDLYRAGMYYPFNWEIDSTAYQNLTFMGYQADTIISSVTGLPRLKYNRQEPVTLKVPYYNQFKNMDSIRIPRAYIVPRSWSRIRERLDWNGIKYMEFEADSSLEVTRYRIEDYKTFSRPYEGHYPHYQTQIHKEMETLEFRAGDLWIPTAQEGVRYLLEALEPQLPDSFFNWNFFDPILQQKEYFSPYVFEDTAAEMLAADSALRIAFEIKKAEDSDFSTNASQQLEWLFLRSPHYEAAHMQYPVYRIE